MRPRSIDTFTNIQYHAMGPGIKIYIIAVNNRYRIMGPRSGYILCLLVSTWYYTMGPGNRGIPPMNICYHIVGPGTKDICMNIKYHIIGLGNKHISTMNICYHEVRED